MSSAEKQPLVDILTPVYNGEKHLEECIESVLAQTYRNWRYTIVNNCSTDRTLEIAQSFAKKDDRIRVHNNKQFLPVMVNLNHAMRQISPESKHVKVVHADDWIYPECISKMVELAEENPSVGIVSSYCLEGNEVKLQGLPYTSTVISGTEICRRHLLGEIYLFGRPSCLLIPSKIVRERENFYDEVDISSDASACYEILKARDFGFVHQVLTYSRIREGQNSQSMRTFNTFDLVWLRHIKQFGPDFMTEKEWRECFKRRMKSYMETLGRSVFDFREKEYWEFHKKELQELGYPLTNMKLFLYALLTIVGIFPFKNILNYVQEKRKHGLQAAKGTLTMRNGKY